MSSEQILWGVNTLLLAVVGVLIKGWMGNVTKLIDKLDARIDEVEDKKQDAVRCEMYHKAIDRKIHTHGILGQAGEVIK